MDWEAEILEAKKLRNPYVTVLAEILKEKIKLDENLVKENNAILKEFLETFIQEMKKCDKLFELLYNRIYYTGSFYSDLRVSKPDEYDLNIVLKLPINLQKLSGERMSLSGGWDPNQPPIEKNLSALLKQKCFVSGNEVKEIKDQNLKSTLSDERLQNRDCPPNLKSILACEDPFLSQNRYCASQICTVQPNVNEMCMASHDSSAQILEDANRGDSEVHQNESKKKKNRPQRKRHNKRVPKIENKDISEVHQNGKKKKKRRSRRKKNRVEYHPQVPSYVKYKVIDQESISKEYDFSRFFQDGYLIPENVRKWMQSVVSKAMIDYTPPRNIIRVRESASGPARTIILVKHQGEIDIDLVPVIECTLHSKPPGINERLYTKVKNDLQCFLVPKPYKPITQPPVNDTEISRLWRAHYPEAENKIIHNVGCAKPVIKLLKLLRDKCEWKIIASYYLKTVVMWMIFENTNEEYWKFDKLGERFLDALRILANCIKERKIRYFFSSRYNLIEKLTDEEAKNIYGSLCNVIKAIETDYKNLWTIFGCPETVTLVN